MNMTDMLDPFITQVVTLKGASAIVVFLIMLGYALKMIPSFPNKFIPFVNFVVGPMLTPIMMAWPMPGTMDPNLRWPGVAAWASSIMAGFLLACVAWIMHAQFLTKWIDDKIPAMNPGRQEEKKTVKSVTTDEAGQRTVTDESKVTVDIDPAPPTDSPKEMKEAKAEMKEAKAEAVEGLKP